ncbi:hypothetical protein GCM10027073_41290 [Streptomyces chlorus]|uniref:TetR/AcrR family transcriptional regulator n=1 Tax=Streptomyces chlorus TaxID=887452 RepID=A0ABW1DWM4_9ACTN
MNGFSSLYAPPGMGTVYRAALDALAQYGPRRTGVTHIARLADTNRPFIYRNWPSAQALVRAATLRELERVLDVARDAPGPLPPPRCHAVRVVVRAARILREHPVVATMARTEPALTHTAVLRLSTVWHDTAWHWLSKHVTGHLPPGAAQDTATLAVLTTALPYALTPPGLPAVPAERAAVDERLSTALHLCLEASVPCPDCPDRTDRTDREFPGPST